MEQRRGNKKNEFLGKLIGGVKKLNVGTSKKRREKNRGKGRREPGRERGEKIRLSAN